LNKLFLICYFSLLFTYIWDWWNWLWRIFFCL